MLVKSFWVKARCAYCNDFFVLCPHKRNLESQLQNHLGGTKHEKVVYVEDTGKGVPSALRTGKRGRPSVSSGSSGVMQSNLHSWFSHAGSESQPGASVIYDKNVLLSLMCWGWWMSHCEYVGKVYNVKGLKNDAHAGRSWCPESEVVVHFLFDGKFVNIEGTFRHKRCARFSISTIPFDNFTCSFCSQIPQEKDFKMRLCERIIL